jgi:hypothetical protein
VALAGILVVAWVVSLPKAGRHEWGGINVQRQAGAMLRGEGSLGDVVADIVGFRGMWYRTEAYPILGPAMRAYGEDWDITHRSTHTPFCHVLVGPISFLPYSVAQIVWGSSMLFLTAVAMWCLGASKLQAIGFSGLLLLWTPFVAALHNIVMFWFLGTCMAYRFRNTRPFRSGILLGVAASTKYLPLVCIAPWITRRRWPAVVGVIGALATLGVIGYLIDPTVFAQYLAVSREAADYTIQRADNAGFLAAAYNHFGVWGVVAGGAFLSGLTLANWSSLWVWRKHGHIDDRAFWLMAFYACALLPISWISSFVVLVPIIAHLFLQHNVLSIVLATAAVVLLEILPPFGDFRIAYVILLVGAGLYLRPKSQGCVVP